MMQAVSKNPSEYRTLLEPFWCAPATYYQCDGRLNWEVFQRELRQREFFREWQLDQRGIDWEYDFDTEVEEYQRYLTRVCGGKGVAEIETGPSSLKGHGGWCYEKLGPKEQLELQHVAF